MIWRARHIYEFGPFLLDEKLPILLRDGQPVLLTLKALETLLALVEGSGRVVGKEELLRKIWPDTFVEEANLAVNVSQLRKALGKRPEGGHYIETVPKRGYRFAGNVRQLQDEEAYSTLRAQADPPVELNESRVAAVDEQRTEASALTGNSWAESEDEESYQPTRVEAIPTRWTNGFGQRKNVLVLIAATLMIAGAIGYFVRFSSKTRNLSATQPRTLAILPFRNLKPSPETDFLSLSLSETLISRLWYVRTLTVSPSSYVEKYRNQDIDPKKAADELNVSVLLTGSYFKEGEDLRVTARLVDVVNNRILWQDTIDEKYDRLIAVQDSIAFEIIKGLQLNLTAAESISVKEDLPNNPKAYEYYSRGRHLISTNDHAAATAMLEHSVALDPNYGLAWAFLGRAYQISSLQFSGSREDYSKARAAFERAQTLKGGRLETLLLVANLYIETNRVEDAIPILREVLAANPNHPYAHWELSYAYRYAGMLPESIAEGERAIQLDMLLKDRTVGHLFNSYYYAGLYEEFMRSLPTREDDYIIFYRGLGYYYLKDWSRAAAAFDRAYELNPKQVINRIGKAFSLAVGSRNREGLEILRGLDEKAIAVGAGDGEISYKMAQAYVALGDKSAAFHALRRSIEQGFFCYPYFVNDPLFESVRAEPEWLTLLEVARSRHQEFKRKFF